jgi:hypothetical protein
LTQTQLSLKNYFYNNKPTNTWQTYAEKFFVNWGGTVDGKDDFIKINNTNIKSREEQAGSRDLAM